MYNKKCLNTQKVTKQELRKCQAEQNPTDSLFDKTLSCPGTSSQFCKLYYRMVRKLEFYRQTLLINFVVKTQTFQTFILLYLTLLVCLKFWFSIKKSNRREKKLGPFQKVTSEAAKAVHARRCCLWRHAQFSEPTSIRNETIFTFKIFVGKVYSGYE